eukprot:COSAG01_NODE_62609_length_283_cov_3.217391_1_plen_36_part_01
MVGSGKFSVIIRKELYGLCSTLEQNTVPAAVPMLL